jgi:hypothetical protein
MAQGVGAARVEGEEPEMSEPARSGSRQENVRAACRARRRMLTFVDIGADRAFGFPERWLSGRKHRFAKAARG